MSIFSAGVMLFFIMDPLGNIPLFISALKGVPPARHKKIILRELIISYIILVGFLFLGQYFLEFLGLRTESVSVGGGIVLFLIAIRMIFPPEKHHSSDHEDEEPFIVPLAIPAVAGPSTLAALILLGNQYPDGMLHWFLALTVAWLLSSVILLGAPFLYSLLKKRGLIAIERLMGMILVSLAIQMFLDGIKQYLD